jgi:rhodanese-related sulfurtransferase
MPRRSLPTIIGPTENALRALLIRALEVTRIDGYDEWVYLNLTDRHESDEKIAVALRSSATSVEAVAGRLRAKGFATVAGLTDSGREQLETGQALVGTMTARLTEGLDPERVRTCMEVLDVLRDRADRELALIP